MFEKKLLAERNETMRQLSKASALEKTLQLILNMDSSNSTSEFWSQLDTDTSNENWSQEDLAARLGNYLDGLGRHSVSTPLVRYPFETAYTKNPNSPEAVRSFLRLFDHFMYRGNYENARQILDRVGGLSWAQQIMGKTAPPVASIARFNAELLENEGKPTEAEQLYIRTIADMLADPHSSSHETLYLRDYLAHFHARQGHLATAIDMYRKLLYDAKRIPEEQHGAMLGMWTSLLGQTLLKEGTPEDLIEADKVLQEAWQLSAPLMATTTIERVNIIIPRAMLLDREHQYAESASYWQKAQTIAREAEISDKQRWHTFARYAESLRQQGLDSKADAVLNQEINDLMAKGAYPALVAEVRHEWEEIWAADAKADAERAARLNSK